MPGTLTEVLAVWGAVVATLSLGWNILRWYRERPKLSFVSAWERSVDKQQGVTEYGAILRIVNGSSRPISITHGWAASGTFDSKRIPKGTKLQPAGRFPATLQPGSYAEVTIRRNAKDHRPDEYVYFAVDTAGGGRHEKFVRLTSPRRWRPW